jgi:hypothetical protein
LKAAFNVRQFLLALALKPVIIYAGMEQVPFKDAMASYFSRIGGKGGKIGGKRKFPGKTEAAVTVFSQARNARPTSASGFGKTATPPPLIWGATITESASPWRSAAWKISAK